MSDLVRTDWPLVAGLYVAGLGAAGQFAKVAVIFPELAAHYPGAGAALGFLVSLISLLGIVLGLVAGMLVAGMGGRRPLLWALWLGAAISALQSPILPLPAMLGLRALEGLSHLAIVVAAPLLIGQVTAPRHRGAAMTLWSTFFGVAFAQFAWGGLPLVAIWGPSSLFWLHALWMALIALWLARRLPAGASGIAPGRPALPGARELLRRHAAVYAAPDTAAPALGWLFYTLTFVSLVTVLPGFVPEGARGAVAGLMPLASIAAALLIAAPLLRRAGSVPLILAGFGLSAAAALGLGLDPGAPLLCLALFAALGLVQGPSFAAIPELVTAPERQALAYGAVAQMGNLGNTLGTPLLLWSVAGAGAAGLSGFALAAYVLGFAVHAALALRRRGPRPA